MDVDEEIRLLRAAKESKAAGVECAVVELGVPGAVGDGAAEVLLAGERLGEQVDGAAEGRGSDGGSGAGAAVEVDAADPLRGEECPGVVGG